MDKKNLLWSGLEIASKQPRTYEILLASSLVAFIMTVLSLLYTLYQPAAGPIYYTIDNSGQLEPASTIQVSDWLSQPDRAVLGEQIERTSLSE